MPMHDAIIALATAMDAKKFFMDVSGLLGRPGDHDMDSHPKP
jgi:hypothetical protein